MNRRSFFGMTLSAIVAVVLPLKRAEAPWQLLSPTLTSDIREQMRAIFNEHARGRTISEFPREVHLGREAFEKFERDVHQNERFVDVGPMTFKAAIVRPVGAGWGMRIVS